MFIRVDMTCVSTPIARVIFRNSEGFQKLFELQKNIILTTTKHVGQDLTAAVINGMPKPSLIFFASNVTPHLISFCFVREPNHHFYFIRV